MISRGWMKRGRLRGLGRRIVSFLASEMAKGRGWARLGLKELTLTEADPAMWYHGGTLGLARYYSRFIALQIKAKILGTPLAVYDKTP